MTRTMEANAKNAIRLPTANPPPSPLTSSDILAVHRLRQNEAEAEGVTVERPRRVSEAEYAGSTGTAKHQEKAPTEAGLVDGVVVQLGFQPHLGRVVLRSEKIRRVAPNKKKAPVLDTQPGLEAQTKKPGEAKHQASSTQPPVTPSSCRA